MGLRWDSFKKFAHFFYFFPKCRVEINLIYVNFSYSMSEAALTIEFCILFNIFFIEHVYIRGKCSHWLSHLLNFCRFLLIKVFKNFLKLNIHVAIVFLFERKSTFWIKIKIKANLIFYDVLQALRFYSHNICILFWCCVSISTGRCIIITWVEPKGGMVN